MPRLMAWVASVWRSWCGETWPIPAAWATLATARSTRAMENRRPRSTKSRSDRSESPRVFWRLSGLESRGLVGRALVMIERLELGWWQVAKSTVQTPVIPPVNPLSGCQLHLLERAPRASVADHLGLVEAIHRLRQRVVIRVSP